MNCARTGARNAAPHPKREGLQELAAGEVANQRQVGGEEVEFGEFTEIDPAHLIVDLVLNFAGEFAYREELQIDRSAVTVIVAYAGDGGTNDGGDAQFFVEFTHKGLLRGFAGFDLAPWKFPLESHDLFRTALADEDPAFANYKGCRYKAKGWTGVLGLRAALGGVHTRSVNLP